MGIVNKKELRKILKYKKELSCFWNKVFWLCEEAPNRSIKEILRKAMSECDVLIKDLTGAKPLEEQQKPQ